MKQLSDIFEDQSLLTYNANSFIIRPKLHLPRRCRINILAMGDVGSTVLIALKLLGSDVISEIGICDLNENLTARLEAEMNQISMPMNSRLMPKVKIVDSSNLFDCDIMVFCASTSVPPLNDSYGDVRMMQFRSNKTLVRNFANQAVFCEFKGLFAVVSDPVDPLCKVALLSGLRHNQVQGFGLGVMNARAMYYAQKNSHLSSYLNNGRAFGPHGSDLVIANDINNYDDDLSRELTKLTVESNVRIRELGFKPYIAPAISSAAISIIEALRGNWQYSSHYFGKGSEGAFLGTKNRLVTAGIEIENISLDDVLFERIKKAYEGLSCLI